MVKSSCMQEIAQAESRLAELESIAQDKRAQVDAMHVMAQGGPLGTAAFAAFAVPNWELKRAKADIRGQDKELKSIRDQVRISALELLSGKLYDACSKPPFHVWCVSASSAAVSAKLHRCAAVRGCASSSTLPLLCCPLCHYDDVLCTKGSRHAALGPWEAGLPCYFSPRHACWSTGCSQGYRCQRCPLSFNLSSPSLRFPINPFLH
jgi:hypothetical protein